MFLDCQIKPGNGKLGSESKKRWIHADCLYSHVKWQHIVWYAAGYFNNSSWGKTENGGHEKFVLKNKSVPVGSLRL